MNKAFLFSTILATSLFASDMIDERSEVDCLVLKDENSIICKYANDRSDEDRFVRFEWIDPHGVASRDRKVLMPKGHGSVYDFRYISGRVLGTWTFKATDGEVTYTTTFELK